MHSHNLFCAALPSGRELHSNSETIRKKPGLNKNSNHKIEECSLTLTLEISSSSISGLIIASGCGANIAHVTVAL